MFGRISAKSNGTTPHQFNIGDTVLLFVIFKFLLLQGEAMATKKLAKMAVALKACEILHKAGTVTLLLIIYVKKIVEGLFSRGWLHGASLRRRSGR